jgi:hypothetical protein
MEQIKYQITNIKYQTNNNNRNSKFQTLGYWILEFGTYLEFGAWNLGFINPIFRVHSFQE